MKRKKTCNFDKDNPNFLSSTLKGNINNIINEPFSHAFNFFVNKVHSLIFHSLLFFNYFIIKSIQNSQLNILTSSSIERTIMLILGSPMRDIDFEITDDPEKNKQNEIFYQHKINEKNNIQKIFNEYTKKINLNHLKKSNFNGMKSITELTRPFFATYYTNISNHCNINFKGFLCKYVRSLINETCLIELSNKRVNKVIGLIVNNLKYDQPIISDKSILFNIEIKYKIAIYNIFHTTKNTIQQFFPQYKENFDLDDDKEIVQTLMFYHFILKRLEERGEKRFSLLPQISFNVKKQNYILFFNSEK